MYTTQISTVISQAQMPECSCVHNPDQYSYFTGSDGCNHAQLSSLPLFCQYCTDACRYVQRLSSLQRFKDNVIEPSQASHL